MKPDSLMSKLFKLIGGIMEYNVLSPRADSEPIKNIALNPRLKDFKNKTIGLYTTFKEHWALINEEIARQLLKKYPTLKFKWFIYGKDLNAHNQVAEVAKDPDYLPKFEEWIKDCDAVITANADAGSCTLYLSYNATLSERLGKPAVLTVSHEYIPLAKAAAALRGVPDFRIVELNLEDLSMEPSMDQFIKEIIPERVAGILDEIEAALTSPLTAAEKSPRAKSPKEPRIAEKGEAKSFTEFNTRINDSFYNKGLSYGFPIVPPTDEAVKEMLTGTDLAPDYVIATIPPMNGIATIEKIAVNAVMAGCVPTHLPVLIAAVQAVVDPRMWIEAYTCSMASWEPLVILNGPIRKDLNVNYGTTYLSPYYRTNACVGHALGLILMNIAGIRPGIEDMGVFGHEGHFGVCIAENEESSPWEPMHEYYGFNRDDSAVSVFFPNTRNFALAGRNPAMLLKVLCENVPVGGFDPGSAIILTPKSAKSLAEEGYSRKAVIDYLVEYARRPGYEMNVRWMKGNYHVPPEVPLPADPARTVRKFFSGMHLPIFVAGNDYAWGTVVYGGGGDHGGPITKKIELPKNWKKLVSRYKDTRSTNV
jgi:hypothetical protein